MKRFIAALMAVVVVVGIAALAITLSGRQASAKGVGRQSTPTCTATGFYRDSINMTARIINPTSTVSGTVNATSCNIGVYFGPGHNGSVNQANIYGANYFGVVNNGGDVSVTTSNIHNIGEVPFNGDQHGVGVYWAYDAGATGTISGNQVSLYQKGGIVVNGPSDSALILGNTVTGLGPVNFIAQNGIQIGFGGSGTIARNIVTGNSYTGNNQAVSTGILFYGPGAASSSSLIESNLVTQNDVGIYDITSNSIPQTSTVTVSGNRVTNTQITNQCVGCGPVSLTTIGYQAGIVYYGSNVFNMVSRIESLNGVSGVGYTPVAHPTATSPFLTQFDIYIDNSNTNTPSKHALPHLKHVSTIK